MRIGIIAAALALGACAEGSGVTAPQAALPVTTAQTLPGAAVASGEARIEVTAIVASDGVRRAVAADCTAEGTGFRAAFAAPAVLAAPTFGPGTSGVRIACAADGRSGAVLAEPTVSRAGAGGVWPVIGVGIGSGYGGGTSVSVGGYFGGGGGWTGGPQGYVVRYPAVAVVLSSGGRVE